jgi:diacylglycerol kinase family enzyme
VDVLLVIGGDGTINTVGAELIGTNTALGAIPMGSGIGFARHFGISLDPEIAAFHLATGMVKSIDVGLMNNRPFLITCSMAWDAAIVRSFQKSPVRGILPYVFAGAYEFFGYEPQPIDVVLETGERLSFPEPLVFTIANLTQYGANLHITDNAEPDDGMMELVVAGKQDIPALLNHLMSLKNRSIAELPSVTCRSFQKLTVIRDHQGVIQLDGELVEAPKVVEVKVLPSALKVLVPMQIEA